MPRIRKETSKRGTLHKRARIKGKIKESRKKDKKASKKDITWKSKHKKDPGIPNNFPYKDQILAEIAAERRTAEDEKQRKKDEKKASRAKLTDAEDSSDDENAAAESSGVGFDGVVTSRQNVTREKGKSGHAEPIVEDEDEEPSPLLINRELLSLSAVLEEADVIVQVLDARDPLAFRSSHVEGIAGKKLVLVLNKIDTCPREAVVAWAAQLRSSTPTFLFRSASSSLPLASEPDMIKGKGKARERDDDGLGVNSVLALLALRAAGKKGDKPLTVAIVGVTNSGKSSFFNSLLKKAAAPIHKLTAPTQGPTTTAFPQEVTIEAGGKPVRLIDTPGWSWLAASSEAEDMDAASTRARDILTRAKGRIDRLKDPALEVAHVVSRSDTEGLMLFYSLPAFIKGDSDAFLTGVARANGFIKKGGSPDMTSAARLVLRDWSTGKFPRYSVPSSTTARASPAKVDKKLADIYAHDENLVTTLVPRKELRKSTGVVKFVPWTVEDRKVDVEGAWRGDVVATGGGRGGAGAGVFGGVADSSDEEDGDGDDDEEEEESEEEEEVIAVDSPAPALSGKQKRKATTQAAGPSAKKVAFAAPPKESKQARSAAGKKGAAVKASKAAAATGEDAGGAYDFNKFF